MERNTGLPTVSEDDGKEAQFSTNKKVDETWKNSVDKEKVTNTGYPEFSGIAKSDFSFFVSALGMQALLALGEVADPSLGPGSLDLKQAQYLIDVIQMLSDKTKGNLTQAESSLLDGLLYELRMKFVQKSQGVSS